MKFLLIAVALVICPFESHAVEPLDDGQVLTPKQVTDAHVQTRNRDAVRLNQRQNRLTRAKANDALVVALPGNPMKRPYYGDNGGIQVMHHH